MHCSGTARARVTAYNYRRACARVHVHAGSSPWHTDTVFTHRGRARVLRPSFCLHTPAGNGHFSAVRSDRDEPLCLASARGRHSHLLIRFALLEDLRCPHDLQLIISWFGPGEIMPDISGRCGDWHEMRTQTDDGVILAGGLALMLWAAPPGTRLQGSAERGTCLPGRGWEFRVSQSDLARAVLSSPKGVPQASFSVLQQLPDGGLLLHPTGPDANVAYVPDGCLAGTLQASATVKVNHPDAEGTVQYALLATRHEPVWELTRLDDPAADPRVVAFSGWQNVPPDQQPYAVCLNFAEPLDRPAHLVLPLSSSPPCACPVAGVSMRAPARRLKVGPTEGRRDEDQMPCGESPPGVWRRLSSDTR